VSALASLDQNRLSILVWHYHDDDVPGPDAAVDLTVGGLLPAHSEARLTHYRIDEEHSNAFAAWKRLGSPQAPTPGQYVQLEKAGQLESLAAPSLLHVIDGQVKITFMLPRQAVSLLVFELN
jgi:xylan 1,4-beta-xylosidase